MKNITIELEYYNKYKFKAEEHERFLVVDANKNICIAVFVGGDFIDETDMYTGDTNIINVAYIKRL